MQSMDMLEPRRLMSATVGSASLTNVSPSAAVPPPPVISHAVIQVAGTSDNDVITVSRTSNSPIPRTSRYFAVINPDGSIRYSAGSVDGPLLNPKLKEGESPAGLLFLGKYIHVNRGAIDFFVDAKSISGVEVFAGGGDDKVTAANNLKLGTTLHGGEGDDTLLGSIRSDHLLGDDGADYLFGGRGLSSDNVLNGGEGDDTVVASSKRDEVVGPPDSKKDRVIVLTRPLNSVPSLAKSIFAANYIQEKPPVTIVGLIGEFHAYPGS